MKVSLKTTKIGEGRGPTSREGTCAISGPTFDDLWTSFHHSREKRVNADPHRENVVLDQIMLRKTFFTDIIDDSRSAPYIQSKRHCAEYDASA